MKTQIFFSLFFLLGHFATAQSHFDTKIGEVSSSDVIITLNEETLFNSWESFLSNYSKITVDFDTAYILKENNKYYLLGESAADSIKSAVILVAQDGSLYESMYKPGVSYTVTCTGCTSGCSPRENENGWYCKDPCSTCVKSETVHGGHNGIW